jgi:hypothetical protein
MQKLFDDAFMPSPDPMRTGYAGEARQQVHEAFKRLISELPQMAGELRAFGVPEPFIADIQANMDTAGDFLSKFASDADNLSGDEIWGEPWAYSYLVRAAIANAELHVARKLLIGDEQ